MQTSLLKTPAAEHRSTVSKMAGKYKDEIQVPHGLRTCIQVGVAREGRKELVPRFGGIPLKQ